MSDTNRENTEAEKAWIGRTVTVVRAPAGYERNVGHVFKVAEAEESRDPAGPLLLRGKGGAWVPSRDVEVTGVVLNDNFTTLCLDTERGAHRADLGSANLTVERLAENLDEAARWLRKEAQGDVRVWVD